MIDMVKDMDNLVYEVDRLNNKANELIAAGKFEEAKLILYKALHLYPTVRTLNNLAVVFFYMGDLRRALKYAIRARKLDRSNIFTNSILAIILHKLGKPSAKKFVLRALDLLRKTRSPPDSHINSVIWSLSFFEDHKNIAYVYSKYRDFIKDEGAIISVITALFNLGHYSVLRTVLAEKRQYIRSKIASRIEQVADYLSRRGLRIRLMYPYNKIKIKAFDTEVEVDAIVALGMLYEICVPSMSKKNVVYSTLGLLAIDNEYLSVIRSVLLDKEIPDDHKEEIIQGILKAAMMGIVDEEKVKNIKVYLHKEHSELELVLRTDEDFDRAVELFEKGLEYASKGDIDNAEKYYKMAIETYPLQEAQLNYANILRKKGRLDEAEKILKNLANEGYILAKLNLAALYMQKENYEVAYSLLKEINFKALRFKEHKLMYLDLYNLLSHKLGKRDEFYSIIDNLFKKHPSIVETYFRDVVSRGDPEINRMLSGLLRILRSARDESERKYNRLSRIKINENMKLMDLLISVHKFFLKDIADMLGISFPSNIRKYDLARLIHKYIMENLVSILGSLDDKEKKVLGVILKNVKPKYIAIKRRFGSDKEDFLEPKERPRTALGKLRHRGLVFVGIDEEGEQVVIVPHDLAKIINMKYRSLIYK